eukprot:Plantae.Rhodophyta-Purpureofilum_apyrenoidigerum.ctg21121.p1 GENE.Plantae.Rhodophyta-Purpureofilum_apyrenoidigerum.ctg21121~~Plantae.Rhodophyta-Purpureofilum_apyrenoidigerum.ctg21121.p1  ORF type:complete len:395 (-),score=74.22 Plantae.Rhodophyta-Purpureofilum_apyrenoidigerum.ctg21121:7-1191(-)
MWTYERRLGAFVAALPGAVRPGRVAVSRCAVMMSAKYRIEMPGLRGASEGKDAELMAGPAIQPMRPPQKRPQVDTYTQGVGDGEMMDGPPPPRILGFWDFVPIVALLAAAGGLGFLGVKRFNQRQKDLVVHYGEDMALYGNTSDNMREITRTFKKKLGPGVLRPQMFQSYVRELFTTGSLSAVTIENVAHAKNLLKVSDGKAVELFNQLGLEVRSQPSVLGKILFVAERILPARALEKLEVKKMFRYGSATVDDLQKSILDRVYREACEKALDEDDATSAPGREADLLNLSQREADMIFQSVIQQRKRAEEEEAARAQEEERQSFSMKDSLDAPARISEPEKSTVHAYQCTDCGYTLFPAAGREFKFFGSDFACPQCGAPKDKFVDLNEEGGDE